MIKSVENKIVEKIKNHKRGKMFFANDFALLGSPDSIRQALQSLQKSGLLVRVATGVYCYPKINKFNSVVPERTFLEKVCLLHEEFSKANEQVRVERMSRHIYDLAKMIDTPIADNALKNKDLFQSIVAHRRMFITIKNFDYNTLNPTTINIIPPESVIDLWKEDYEKPLVVGNGGSGGA